MKNRKFSTSGKLILANAKILPSASEDVIEKGAVAIVGDQIVDVGPSQQVIARNKDATQQIDLTDYILTPGLINGHCHSPMGFFRGVCHRPHQSSDPNLTMIETIFYPAERSLDPEIIEALCYSNMVDALKSGITSSCESYFYSDGIARAAEKLGLRIFLGEHIADLGGPIPAGVETWHEFRGRIDHWPYKDHIHPMVYAHATDTVSAGLLKELAEFARRRGLPFHMHLSQSDGERARTLARSGKSPVQYASEARALGPNSMLVHLISVDDHDLDLLADSGSYAGITPVSEIIFERLPPIEKMISREIPICLGSDGPASNDGAHLLEEIKTFALLMKDRGVLPQHYMAKSILATIWDNPAQALGRKDLGRIAVGAKADLVALQATIDVLPDENLAENIVYSFQSRHVDHVMINGQWVLWKGHLVMQDERDLKEAYRIAAKTVWKRAGF